MNFTFLLLVEAFKIEIMFPLDNKSKRDQYIRRVNPIKNMRMHCMQPYKAQ